MRKANNDEVVRAFVKERPYPLMNHSGSLIYNPAGGTLDSYENTIAFTLNGKVYLRWSWINGHSWRHLSLVNDKAPMDRQVLDAIAFERLNRARITTDAAVTDYIIMKNDEGDTDDA